ncbi:MAG: DUF389 domain-containing protein [Bacteroidia bacterium]|nr:DUF389 domain-containing protein [Bacteroidia bacterium]
MKEILVAIKNFLKDRFNLYEDKADERLIVTSIRKNIDFKGPRLWVLIFAILIASIGLNVNSAAVIIGAMLISPLMGPIMGVGLGIAINDIDMLKKGLKNVLIAFVFSIAASAIYFLISPLHEAKSELLARTTPSMWDVFIAFFGGLAGIVSGTRKHVGTVIPGVAIATALMPPLCTAGFGLATGNFIYFLGAVYLFFINSVFICIATFLIVRHLKFHRHEFADIRQQKRVIRNIFIVVVLTIVPSIYLSYKIVQRSIFEKNSISFVQNEFNFKQTQVVSKTFKMVDGKKIIDLILIGKEIPETSIDSLKRRLRLYNLNNTELIIRQGLNAKKEIDLAQIKASILEDVFKEEKTRDSVPVKISKLELPIPDIKKELQSLYPDLTNFSLTQSVIHNIDSLKTDTLTLFVGKFTKRISSRERKKLSEWLKLRIQSDSVKILIE